MRAAAGVLCAALALVVAGWGVNLIWKASTGGMPDSRPATIVVIGIVLILCGLVFGATAVTMLRGARQTE